MIATEQYAWATHCNRALSEDDKARAKGFTVPCYIEGGAEAFEALVKADDDYDGKFVAWSMDWQMYVTVSGWAVIIEWEG